HLEYLNTSYLNVSHRLHPSCETTRIYDQRLIIRASVEHNRHRTSRRNACSERVKRQLADGDAHAADAEVAEAKDALAVCDDDNFRVRVGRVGQYRVNVVTLRVSDKKTARAAIDATILLTALADDRRVDDGRHLG